MMFNLDPRQSCDSDCALCVENDERAIALADCYICPNEESRGCVERNMKCPSKTVVAVIAVIILLSLGGMVLFLYHSAPTLVHRSFGSHVEPETSPETHLAFLVTHEENGRAWSYSVVAYGRKIELTAAPREDDILVDGKVLTLPEAVDGAVWALTPDLSFQRLVLAPQEGRDVAATLADNDFMSAPWWRGRLRPILQKIKWPSK
jgi:hypothetical protein